MSREKTCPKCETHFQCGPGTSERGDGCWCQDLPPAVPLASGADCMCPQCLTQTIRQMADARRA